MNKHDDNEYHFISLRNHLWFAFLEIESRSWNKWTQFRQIFMVSTVFFIAFVVFYAFGSWKDIAVNPDGTLHSDFKFERSAEKTVQWIPMFSDTKIEQIVTCGPLKSK